MHLTSAEMDLFKISIPSLATAVVSIFAIRANRQTSAQALAAQAETEAAADQRKFKRDQRLEAYVELLDAVDKAAQGGFKNDVWEIGVPRLYTRVLIFGSPQVMRMVEAWQELVDRGASPGEISDLTTQLFECVRRELGSDAERL